MLPDLQLRKRGNEMLGVGRREEVCPVRAEERVKLATFSKY